ncbi:Uncharacterised protein [Mycobacteroides abscessus subsp. abscessus]|nr:Uncharacterised protein [Mycobacteroides abscessus subsp. abscessus]
MFILSNLEFILSFLSIFNQQITVYMKYGYFINICVEIK